MLRIDEIQIGHTKEYCVTDRRPNIRFSLESDIEGEALDYAMISCGSWKITTQDQLNNTYGGDWKPFTEYEITIEAVGKRDKLQWVKSRFHQEGLTRYGRGSGLQMPLTRFQRRSLRCL